MTFRLTRIAAILTVTMLGAAYAQPSPPDIPKSVDSVLSNEKFRKAMAHIGSEHERIVDEITKLTEIPAPPFKEATRANAFLALLRASGIRDAVIDEEGNVVGLRKGHGKGTLIAISTHLDTVFPEGTNVKVRRQGTRLYAPGVGDASRYLAILLAMVRALDAAGIQNVERHPVRCDSG